MKKLFIPSSLTAAFSFAKPDNLRQQIFSFALILLLPNAVINENEFPTASNENMVVSKTKQFVNSIVDGNKCNTFGYEKYVQNSDTKSAYNVTLKVVSFKAGSGSKESQKIVAVPAGGKTYAGCSESVEMGGPGYTYTVIGESKQ